MVDTVRTGWPVIIPGGYGALSGTQTFDGNKTFSGTNIHSGPATISGLFTFTTMPLIPVNADVAAAGSTVSDAAQLSSGFTVVTGANGTLGVKLPATPTAGTMVIIKGTTAGVLKVWPDAAATINAIGSNGAISLASGAVPAIFIAKSATQWYTLPLLPS